MTITADTAELRYVHLPFRRFLAAARAEHRRRLSLPWYLEPHARDNAPRAVWRRQIKRYAEWYAKHRLGANGWNIWVSDAGEIRSGSTYLGNLPPHAMLGFTQEQPTCHP